jgi:hypothetical protein
MPLKEIKRWDNGKVIVCGEYESIKDCLQKNSRANLSRANLSRANLSGADLSRANLSGANLSRADLLEANLLGADLKKLIMSPPLFLLAWWGNVSDELCLDLMRYDAANHPNPEKFLDWAKGGRCPYSDVSILRSANFIEKLDLIKADFLARPVKSAYELMQAIIKEKGKS